YFLSNPVIKGFTSAAAIIIGMSQLRRLLRIELPNTQYVQEIIGAFVQNIGNVHWLTLAIGILGIAIIKMGKKIHPFFPSSLVAVVFGIFLVWGFNLAGYGVQIVGEVPAGLPSFSIPSFDFSLWSQLFPIALTIALVGFGQSYAIAKTLQAQYKDYELRAGQELVALGISNVGAAFFNGYSVSGGFSRSAVNNDAGANTALSSIFSAVFIVLTLLFFTDLFYHLPNSILAAVVLAAVTGLIDIKEPLNLWRKDKADFMMLMATFLTTLIFGIELGIISG